MSDIIKKPSVEGEVLWPFKVKMKPTLWVVTLSQGAWSDYTEKDYYIHANDKGEAWYLFKEYWRQTITADDSDTGLEFEDEVFNHVYPNRMGGDWDVDIENINVIEFHKR